MTHQFLFEIRIEKGLSLLSCILRCCFVMSNVRIFRINLMLNY